ncbi:MAG: hypothetical protein ABEH88_06305 [Halobacteriales archaeon]
MREDAEAWEVIAGYFEEFTVADREAADVRGPPEDDGRGLTGTAYAAWRTYKRLRRLF